MIELNSTAPLSLPAVSMSGVSTDFLNVPVNTKKIEITLSGFSTNGTTSPCVRIGNGSFVTTGYNNSCSTVGDATSGGTNTAGFVLMPNTAPSNVNSGEITLTNIVGNTWVMKSLVSNDGINFNCIAAGNLTLSGVLDRVQVTTTGGDTIDGGTAQIKYYF